MPGSFYFLLPPHRLPDAPKVGQHVRIEGQPGVYVVLRLNTKRYAADLMLTTGRHELEEDVPYFAIEPVRPEDKRHAKESGPRPGAESETTSV